MSIGRSPPTAHARPNERGRSPARSRAARSSPALRPQSPPSAPLRAVPPAQPDRRCCAWSASAHASAGVSAAAALLARVFWGLQYFPGAAPYSSGPFGLGLRVFGGYVESCGLRSRLTTHTRVKKRKTLQQTCATRRPAGAGERRARAPRLSAQRERALPVSSARPAASERPAGPAAARPRARAPSTRPRARGSGQLAGIDCPEEDPVGIAPAARPAASSAPALRMARRSERRGSARPARLGAARAQLGQRQRPRAGAPRPPRRSP